MSLPGSRHSRHSSESRSRSHSKEKDKGTLLDSVKKQLSRLSGNEDDPQDGASAELGAISKAPPPPIPPLKPRPKFRSPSPPRKPIDPPPPQHPAPRGYKYKLTGNPQIDQQNVDRLQQELAKQTDKYNQELEETERKTYTNTALHFLTESVTNISDRLHLMEENQKVISQQADRNREIPDPSLQGFKMLAKELEKVTTRLDSLENGNPINSKKSEDYLQEFENLQFKSALKERKKKKKKKSKFKDTSSSDSASSSGSNSSSEEDNFVPKPSATSPACAPQDATDWKRYLDKKKPLYLYSDDYLSAWISEGRPKLKMKIKTMAQLQTKHSTSLKQLKETSKEFNERINSISKGSMETFSINNIAQRTRTFLIRFGVNTKLFNHILVEYCLNPTLKNLALSNPTIMEDTENNLLTWLSQRTLNSSSEQRLKRDIKNYLKNAIKTKANMSSVISNLEGIYIPELLQASEAHSYASSNAESRQQQNSREARSFLLDSLEEHAPVCFAYLGMDGVINSSLDVLGRRIESFQNFNKQTTPKTVGQVGVDKQSGTIMDQILDLEQQKKIKKQSMFEEMRRNCAFHKGDIESCKAEKKQHCFVHSKGALYAYPCQQCPVWLQQRRKKE